MPLGEFAGAVAVEGFDYELEQGVVVVTEIPGVPHLLVVRNLCQRLAAYELRHPGLINVIAVGSQAKIVLRGRQTERHPDVMIYLTPPPPDTAPPWDRWIPEIVVEVVSETSARRDYETKRDDYLAGGVQEYWIVDPRTRSGLFLVRRGDVWDEHRVGSRGTWKSALRPGFPLSLADIFPKPGRRT